MKTLEIKKGYLVQVDDEDFDRIRIFPWKIFMLGKGSFYCGFSLKLEEKKYKKVWLQHMIVGNPPEGKRIYFKDKNPLNCTKANIEFLSYSEYGHMTHKKTEDKYLGVILEYIARIRVKNKLKVIGVFDSAREAALAYDLEAKKVYGDRAVLNFEEAEA